MMWIDCRLCLVAALLMVVCGCNQSERVELGRTRAELDKTRVELVQLQARLLEIEKQAAAHTYLEELEKLETLKTRGVLTQEEFDVRKRVILERQSVSIVSRAEGPKTGMDELAKQLRTLASLYGNGTITMQERDAKRAQVIQRPLQAVELKKDLETVQSLYNDTSITMQDRDALKKKVLEFDTGK